MNLLGRIDRLDDFINPIVVKELRQAVKSWLVIGVLLLFLGLQVFVLAVSILFRDANPQDALNWRAGNELFQVIQALLLGTCMILIPAYTAIRLASERSDSNVDLLFISTLRPRAIISGKFLSAIVMALLVYSCCAPFMTFTYLLRGIDIPSILLVLGLDLLATIFSTQFALFLASLPAARVIKIIALFAGLFVLIYLFIGMVEVVNRFTRQGLPNPREFWAGLSLVTLLTVGATGLLFCWSVALISPPSANRAPPSRLWMVGTWIVMGLSLMGISWYLPAAEEGAVIAWMFGSSTLFCVQLLISINERDSWGPRVARTIPRSFLFRPAAFLFYSGAAGGILLALLGLALTLLASLAYFELVVIPRRPSGMHLSFDTTEPLYAVMRFLGALALFTYCYGLSAVLLRKYVIGDQQIRSSYTWVIAFLLVALGSSVPAVLAYIIYYDDMWRRGNTLPWWNLTNPFAALYDLGPGSRYRFSDPNLDFAEVLFVVLTLWAGLVTVLSFPWMLGQMLRFHPPSQRHPRRREPEEIIETQVVSEVEDDPNLLDSLIEAEIAGQGNGVPIQPTAEPASNPCSRPGEA